MAVTEQQVIDRVNAALPNNAIFLATEKLAAINAAIDAAYPKMANVGIDSSIVLASTTYEYTPTATDVPANAGFALAYVTLPSAPKHLLRRVTQRRSAAAWKILVPRNITYALSGETLHLQYYKPYATLSALTDSVELPLDYLWKYAAYFLCLSAMAKAAEFDRKPYEALAAQYEKMAEQSRMGYETHKVYMIPHAVDRGQGSADVPSWSLGNLLNH